MESTYTSKELIDQTYIELSKSVDVLYEFALLYYDYIYRAHDYGNGDKIRMVEVHTLTMIEMHPGVTVTELAKMWKRTKGTVSINVNALEKRGYIYREKTDDNAKVVHLYATPKGVALSTIHKVYDNLEIVRKQAALLRTCTPEDINSFFKVLHAYIPLLTGEESE